MLKITKSLMTISLVAALAIGVTTAYFSDKEISKGNTFTAGTLDLKIDSECHFNGAECICRAEGQSHAGECYWDKKDASGNFNGQFGDGEVEAGNECSCVWDEKSLTNEKFFNFANLKPGDSGEATISMHVIGDDAYARFKVANVKNNDRGCNRQEKKSETWMYGAGAETCDWYGGGELGRNMDFAIWFDMGEQLGYQGKDIDPKEGDNILNTPLEYGAMVQADGDGATDWVELKTPGGIYIPFIDCRTYYIGVAWCVGTMTIDSSTYTMTCDGLTAGNIIQSDSYISDSIFEVVQATHNDLANPFSGITP